MEGLPSAARVRQRLRRVPWAPESRSESGLAGNGIPALPCHARRMPNCHIGNAGFGIVLSNGPCCSHGSPHCRVECLPVTVGTAINWPPLVRYVTTPWNTPKMGVNGLTAAGCLWHGTGQIRSKACGRKSRIGPSGGITIRFRPKTALRLPNATPRARTSNSISGGTILQRHRGMRSRSLGQTVWSSACRLPVEPLRGSKACRTSPANGTCTVEDGPGVTGRLHSGLAESFGSLGPLFQRESVSELTWTPNCAFRNGASAGLWRQQP